MVIISQDSSTHSRNTGLLLLSNATAGRVGNRTQHANYEQRKTAFALQCMQIGEDDIQEKIIPHKLV